MIIGTAFSGIGAPEQALKQARQSHKIVFACENDSYVRQTYLANYEHPSSFPEDINSVAKLPRLNLFIFGSPCQSFSVAGHKAGMDDYRATLALKTLRLIQDNPPDAVIFENVKGLVNIDNGDVFRHILKQFETIGYHVHSKMLNSLDYGLPMRRERLFIVATKTKGFKFHEPIGSRPSIKKFLSSHPYDPTIYATKNFLAMPKVKRRMDFWKHDYINCITHTIFRKGSSAEYIGYVSAVNHAIGESRIPTVDECVKLFGFSSSFRFPDNIATGRRYNMLANSMAVPVIRAIIQQVISCGFCQNCN